MHKRTGLVGHNSGIKGLPYKIMGCAAWGEGKPAPGRGLGAGQADRASATGKQRKDSTFGVRMLNPGSGLLSLVCCAAHLQFGHKIPYLAYHSAT
jgi:hypothetical protein